MVILLIVTAPSFESSDTSVKTLRLIRPSDSTTGVKFSETPNFLNSTVPAVHTPAVHEGGVGTGNSPPTRKLAPSPEMAVRFGSARTRITPARSMAWIVALTDLKVVLTKESLIGLPNAENGLLVWKLRSELPNAKLPSRLMPSCLITSR